MMENAWINIPEDEARLSIIRINQSIENIEPLISHGVSELKRDPKNFSLKLAVDSLNSKRGELHVQLASIMHNRVFESVDLALEGVKYPDHTADIISLGTVLQVIQRLYSSIAQTITKGPTERGRIGDELEYLTQLRFAKTYPSSFGISLVVNTNADMFGDSISLSSLKTLFSLLNVLGNKEKLFEKQESLSSRTIGHFRCLFRLLIKQKAVPKLSWREPSGNEKQWKASLEEIATAASYLDTIKKELSEDFEIPGMLAGASLLKNKFEFISDSNEIITGRVSNDCKRLLGEYFAKNCLALIEKVIAIDTVTGDEKYSYVLKNIK